MGARDMSVVEALGVGEGRTGDAGEGFELGDGSGSAAGFGEVVGGAEFFVFVEVALDAEGEEGAWGAGHGEIEGEVVGEWGCGDDMQDWRCLDVLPSMGVCELYITSYGTTQSELRIPCKMWLRTDIMHSIHL